MLLVYRAKLLRNKRLGWEITKKHDFPVCVNGKASTKIHSFAEKYKQRIFEK